MTQRWRMSPVDTAWLRMDAPGNRMTIVGIDLFDGHVDMARLCRLVEAHLLCHREFRCRVETDLVGAWWVEDAPPDIAQHVLRVRLPGAAGPDELKRLVGELASQPLDRRRPLWEFLVVENYPGGDALIVRMHHCIADGVALNRLLLQMASGSPEVDSPAPAPAPSAPKRAPREPWSALLEPLTELTVGALDSLGDATARALRASAAALAGGKPPADVIAQVAKVALRALADAASLALMPPDTTTSLKGHPSGTKVVAWNEPLPLDEIKAVGRALGCSVNDVLLACVAGSFSRYLAARGESVAGAELRAMVPVNLRAGNDGTLGNRFGLVPLLLPLGIANPVARVVEVHRRMTEFKEGYMAVVAITVLGAAGRAPRATQRMVLDWIARKGSAVMTNVHGPDQAIYMAGRRIKQMMFWVPQSGDIGIGVSILSYDGRVQFGLVADQALCPEPQRIIAQFVPEFENLVHAVLLLPWDASADAGTSERALAATEDLAAAATALAARAHRNGTDAAAAHAAPEPSLAQPATPAAAPVPRAAPRRSRAPGAAPRARRAA